MRNISHQFQSLGKLLDRRRRAKFSAKSVQFKEECELLGLFQARLPGFSQLFFHSFTEQEVEWKQAQSEAGGVVSRRAAEAYLRSRVRLQSSCGISDLWYNYVESNATLFHQPKTSSPPTFPSGSNGPPGLPAVSFPSSPSLHPRLDNQQMQEVQRLFAWDTLHSRPRPIKKPIRPFSNKLDANAKDSTRLTTTTVSPFSNASSHPSLRMVDGVDQESKEGEVQGSKVVEMGGQGQYRDEPSQVELEAEGGLLPSAVRMGEGDDVEEYDFGSPRMSSSYWRGVVSAVDGRSAELSAVQEAMDVGGGQVEGEGGSRKRAHQDSDDREDPQRLPPLRRLTSLAQWMKLPRCGLPKQTGNVAFRALRRSASKGTDYKLDVLSIRLYIYTRRKMVPLSRVYS